MTVSYCRLNSTCKCYNGFCFFSNVFIPQPRIPVLDVNWYHWWSLLFFPLQPMIMFYWCIHWQWQGLFYFSNFYAPWHQLWGLFLSLLTPTGCIVTPTYRFYFYTHRHQRWNWLLHMLASNVRDTVLLLTISLLITAFCISLAFFLYRFKINCIC